MNGTQDNATEEQKTTGSRKPLKQLWAESRGKVVAAFVGAVIAATLTQTFAIRNFARLVRYQHSTEVLRSTILGIGFLKQVEGELDQHTSALLNGEYLVTLEFDEPHEVGAGMRELLRTAAASETNAIELQKMHAMEQMYNGMTATVAKVKKLELPLEQLTTTVWDHGAPEVADIQYTLLREISDYYLLVHRVNNSTKVLTELQVGSQFEVGHTLRLKKLVGLHNENVNALKKRDYLELKHRITAEMERLSVIRSKAAEDLP